ncbi:kinesin heavy chain-like [Mytilus edulis]|uniref:kinesin heavy chain-like n=1 Tax=Mytilus edulis TaxID=6550 RepID=UPI0039EE9B8A
MASKLGCSVCNQRKITKPSVVWCSECNEGLCEDYREHHSLSNATTNHETVPIAKYTKLPAEVLRVAQFCQIHNEKYELFRRKHDSPCCKQCVEMHNKCKDLTDINNMIGNIKSSAAFLEIDHTLSEVADNFKRIRINREENLASIREKRKAIEIQIQDIRTMINERLDKLQDDIMGELKTVEERESNKIRQLLSSLIQKEKEIFEYQGHFENTKQYASEYQSFLTLKQIEKYVANEDHFIQSIIKEEHANQIDITCSVDTSLQTFTASMKKFGDVLVNSSPCNITILKRKFQQAQIIVAQSTRNFDSITLRLKQKIQDSLTNIRGCTFLPGGKMVFFCLNRKELEVFMPNGSQEFILSNIGRVFDVVYIGDGSSAVTSGGTSYSRQIHIVDIDQRIEKNRN